MLNTHYGQYYIDIYDIFFNNVNFGDALNRKSNLIFESGQFLIA